MEKEIIKELFEQPSKDFANHLELQDNHRIILSGRYGIGKTTFLKHFFSAENNAKTPTGKQYNAVHLFPINYPVANNEDIFEYIKYDIIAHLLSVEEIEFEKIDIPLLQSLPNFLLRRPADVIAPILHFFGGAGKAYENWKQLIDEFVKEHEEQQVDDKKMMLDFLQQKEETPGGIYENETEIDPHRNIIIIKDVVSLIGYDKDFLQIEEYGLKLTYKIKDHHYDGIWTEDLQILDNNDEKAEDMPNVFFMCLKALELLVNKGYFK